MSENRSVPELEIRFKKVRDFFLMLKEFISTNWVWVAALYIFLLKFLRSRIFLSLG